jgi:hypothetical protein
MSNRRISPPAHYPYPASVHTLHHKPSRPSVQSHQPAVSPVAMISRLGGMHSPPRPSQTHIFSSLSPAIDSAAPPPTSPSHPPSDPQHHPSSFSFSFFFSFFLSSNFLPPLHLFPHPLTPSTRSTILYQISQLIQPNQLTGKSGHLPLDSNINKNQNGSCCLERGRGKREYLCTDSANHRYSRDKAKKDRGTPASQPLEEASWAKGWEEESDGGKRG